MKNLKLTIIILITCFVFSCKKEQLNNNQDEKVTIKGEVKFPTGSKINMIGCNLNSFWTEQTLTSKDYEVEVNKNDFNIQFLSDKNDKTVMLGFTYPNQTDFTIDANSTILGLLMKVPSINNLTDSQKIEFIRDIKTNVKYADALRAVETHILNELDIFDTTDVVMQQKLSSLFDNNVLRRGSGFGYDKQIYITRDSLNLTFGNPGVSFVQVVGIYDYSNTRIAKLEVDRYKMYLTSVFDIPNTIFTTPNPIETKYTLPKNGTYKIKIRNGGFNPLNNDLESREAINANTINLVLDNIEVFIPLKFDNQCLSSIKDVIESKINLVMGSLSIANDKSKYLELVYNISVSVIEQLKLGTTCGNITFSSSENSFIDKVTGLIKYVDWFGKVGTYMNNTVFTFEYFTSNTQNPISVLDTIITVGSTNDTLKYCFTDNTTPQECYSCTGNYNSECATKTWYTSGLNYYIDVYYTNGVLTSGLVSSSGAETGNITFNTHPCSVPLPGTIVGDVCQDPRPCGFHSGITNGNVTFLGNNFSSVDGTITGHINGNTVTINLNGINVVMIRC